MYTFSFHYNYVCIIYSVYKKELVIYEDKRRQRKKKLMKISSQFKRKYKKYISVRVYVYEYIVMLMTIKSGLIRYIMIIYMHIIYN